MLLVPPHSHPKYLMTMRTRIHTPFIFAALTASTALLFTACGSEPAAPAGSNAAAHSVDGAHATEQGTANTTAGTATHTTATDVDRTTVATIDTTEIHIHPTAMGKPQYNERFTTSRDIRGYRARLMAELEAIRGRLNDGTRATDVAQKDQERAADLAQGLERMDRLIKAIEESDDVTWTSIRTSQLKEAEEVRSWAAAHGYRTS